MMNLALMVIQVVIGVLGSFLHLRGILENTEVPVWDRFIFGAPVFAPLLFADLAVLAILGLWAQWRYLAGAAGQAPA
jgi:hypothetical protein